jgi:PAS domain S-box-containing protein
MSLRKKILSKRDRLEIETIWVSALRAAAGVARKAALNEEDVLQAVTEEFRRLKLRCSVLLLTEDAYLEIRSSSLSRSLKRSLKRLSGMQIEGYRFDPQLIDVYRDAFLTGEAIYTDDRTPFVRQMTPKRLRGLLPRIMRLIGNQPAIIAPLILAERPLGAITVTASWLGPEDVPMVSALADHIAITLEHVRTRIEMEAGLARERIRNQVAEAVASALELPVVLDRVIRLAAELTGAEAGAIGLIDPDGENVSYPHLFGLPEEIRSQPAHRGQGLTWRVIENRTEIVVPEYTQHPDAIPAWVQAGVRSLIGVPLIAGDEIIGVLGLFTKSGKPSFSQEHVEMARAIARVSSIAIKNARLYSDANRRAKEAQALIQTARSISASLDQDTVLHLISEQAKALLQADASRIHLLDPTEDTLRCVIALGTPAEAAMSMELEPGEGLTGYVVEHGEPIIVNNAAEDPRSVPIPGTPADELECLALAPLRVRQRTMGAMTVRREGLDRPFTSFDLDLLTAFAAQAAVTLENAHLFGQIASQAQQLEIEVAERTRELAISEARYRALVETSLAGIFQINLKGKIEYVNQAVAELLEYQQDELIGHPLTDFIPRDLDSIMNLFSNQLDGERPPGEVYDVELPARSGRRISVLLAASPITDHDGSPQGISGLVLDISKLKELEAALQAERDRLDALLTNIGDAVMVTDPNGVIEYVNPGWERLNGYTASEALGKTPSISQSGHQSEEFYAEMWEAIRSGQTWRGEVVNCRKDGTFYDAALTITPVLDESGMVINFVGVQHDISSLKELDRLKSQFVSDVSHELRTPLTNIRLYLDLLEKTTGDRAKAARYLRTLSRESERLANLIDDLLSLSRLDAGAVPFEPVPLDVNRLLSALVEDRRSLAAKRGLQLTMDPDLSLPLIIGDDRLLTQVFTNLLTNAMNYTLDGGQITLRTSIKNIANREWVQAMVEDTGLGISPNEINMIFHRFFRGSASQTTNAAGTGLGLAICREIVERHGGRITVESEGVAGRGSLFCVWLPSVTQD